MSEGRSADEDARTQLMTALENVAKSADALSQFCELISDAKHHLVALQTGVKEALGVAERWETIRVHSVVNQATPLEPVNLPIPPSQAIPRPTILMIDDEEIIVDGAKETLEGAGYHFIGCTNPFQALEMFRERRESIDLVILDYTLPIMNGAEVFTELQAIDPHVRVVLSSGYSEQKEIQTMLTRGLFGFLPKPYDAEKLILHVKLSTSAVQKNS